MRTVDQPVRRYGHLFGPPPDGTPHISALVGARRSAETRPNAVTYEADCIVGDQGDSSTCESWAWLQAFHLRALLAGTPIPMPSHAMAIALAYLTDQGRGVKLVDQGTYARTMALVFSLYGLCDEARWPFEKLRTPDGSVQVPPLDVLQAGGDARVSSFASFNSSGAQLCEDLRDALAKKYVPTMGITVDQAFEDGRFDVWNGPTGATLGGHAQCIVGYRPGAFRVVNSWGSSWGDRGFYWISDDAIQSPACSDFMAVDVAPTELE